MRQSMPGGRRPRLAPRWTTSALLVALWLTLNLAVSAVLAQSENIVPGSTVRVANTDGERLNLRAGPSSDQAVVIELEPGATLKVTGAAQTGGGTRWLPVSTAAGQAGWVSGEYVQVVSTPAPTATRTPRPETTATPEATVQSAESSSAATPVPGKPLALEAKLKYPEVQGREQEVTVWVTRDGLPVPDVLVTVLTVNGDDEERFEELDPTNEEGRTRRSFDIRREKGTVELVVKAVAPDGGEGQTSVSYFRR